MKNEPLQYPPTIEEINHVLLEPFLDVTLKVTYKNEEGDMESCVGSLTYHDPMPGDVNFDLGQFYHLKWFDLNGYSDEMILSHLDIPFDKESPESESLIVFEEEGLPLLLEIM